MPASRKKAKQAPEPVKTGATEVAKEATISGIAAKETPKIMSNTQLPNDDVYEGLDDTGASNGSTGAGFRINFGEIKGLEPIADGKYDAVIAKAEFGMSQKQQPKCDIRWKIEEEGDFQGRIVFDTLSFADAALWRVKEVLVALGFDEDFNDELTADMLFGMRGVITVATEPQTQLNPATGKPWPARPRVKAVAPIGSNASLESMLG